MPLNRVTFLSSRPASGRPGAEPAVRVVTVTPGRTVLWAALRARLPIARSCRGLGVCAACRVRVVGGQEGLLEMGAGERALGTREGLRAGERYACLARVVGDVTITAGYW